MKSVFKIALVVIVAALVVSTGLLYATGKLTSNGASSATYSSTSPQYNSPNVVSSNQVNKSMGGNWSQTTGSTATASNASAGMAIIEGGGSSISFTGTTPLTTYVMPGYNQIVGKMPYISLQNSNAQSISATPSTSSTTSNTSPLNGLTSLEFAVFQPTSGAGIVTVGYISEKNLSIVTQVWTAMNNSAANSTSANVSMGMTAAGTPYIYGYFESSLFEHVSTAFNATGMYVNVMLSVYTKHLILVLHLSTVNESLNSTLSLMNSEVSILEHASSEPAHPIFITSTQIQAQTGINETNFLQVDVNIQNASTLYKEFVNTSNMTTTSSESAYMGEAMSNISTIAFSTYGDGQGNATLVGLLKFNNNFNTTLFNGFLTLTHNYSKVFKSSTLNGSRYVFFSENSTISASNSNISIVLFDYNSYIGLIEIVNHNTKLVSQSGMEVLLGEEILLL